MNNRRLLLPGFIVAALLLFACLLWSITLGAAEIERATVFTALLQPDETAFEHLIIRTVRLPRVLGGVLVGVALAVAGAIMQALTRNPLADSGILGINAGAAFAVVVTVFLLRVSSLGVYALAAMALAQQTDILLLDEPTTFLDLAYQMDVLELLQSLNVQGRTIVMVLHDLNQAARYADTIVALRGGQIVVRGTAEEIMTAENIFQVFGLRSTIVTDPVTETPMCVPIGRGGVRRAKSVGQLNGRAQEPTGQLL